MVLITGDATGAAAGPAPLVPELPVDVLIDILRRLDGQTLASAAMASSFLRSLALPLWPDLCHAAWPATADPLVASSFRESFRSLFSDAFPRISSPGRLPETPPQRLISAVDLRRGGSAILSETVAFETHSAWFLSAPFRIDALDPREPRAAAKPPPAAAAPELVLSWVVIDPAGGRAANLASRRPVSIERHCLSGETQARFATVLSGAGTPVQAAAVVSFGGDAEVREVSLHVEDLEGRSLSGRESLPLLQAALEGGRRKRRSEAEEDEEDRRAYAEFVEKRRERKEKKMRMEGRLDMGCVLSGVSIFAAFFIFLMLP